jgi:hypothetical protein
MILDRFAARQALKATAIVLMGLGSLPIRFGPAHVQGAPSNRRPAVESQGALHIDGETARAPDRGVPRSAERHTVLLTVLDDETSRPLIDAEVRIDNQIDSQIDAFRTGPRGRLLVEYPSPHGEPKLRIEVRKNGYVPLARWGFEGSSAQPEALTLRLRRGATMGGIVVAAEERPVEGATVLLSVMSYGSGARPANSTGSEYYFRIPSRTGPDGRWRTDSVPPGAGEVKLQLFHPDFVSDGAPTLGGPVRSPKPEALRAQSDRQILLRGLALEGRVIDEEGRPIAGARIKDSTRGLGFSEFAWCHPTGADGRFPFHLPRGESFLLTAVAEGYVAGTQAVSLDPQQPAIAFQLKRGKRLRGRVVDRAGHPIEAARVIAMSDRLGGTFAFDTWTDEHGRFEWDEAPAEAVRLQFTAEAYVENVRQLTAGDAVAEITLMPAIDVRIVAIDAQTREAIPRFHTQIGTRDAATNEFRWGPRMGRSGRFEISLAADEGPYQFEISAVGYHPSRFLLPGERMVERKTIALEKAAK